MIMFTVLSAVIIASNCESWFVWKMQTKRQCNPQTKANWLGL